MKGHEDNRKDTRTTERTRETSKRQEIERRFTYNFDTKNRSLRAKIYSATNILIEKFFLLSFMNINYFVAFFLGQMGVKFHTIWYRFHKVWGQFHITLIHISHTLIPKFDHYKNNMRAKNYSATDISLENFFFAGEHRHQLFCCIFSYIFIRVGGKS